MIKRILIQGIKAYQKISRTVFFNNCRFHPSCSQYAIEAIERFGPRTGIKKFFGRLLRCTPLNPGGYDPVR